MLNTKENGEPSELQTPPLPGQFSTEPARQASTSVESFSFSFESTVDSDSAGEGRGEGFNSAIVNRFRLETLLGKGGFGEVWKAFDLQRNKYVAVKGPRTDRPVPAAHIQQFLAEAEKVQRVGGKAVVPVLDVVHCPARKDGEFLCFIVMELMTGGSLGERMKNGYRPTTGQTVTLTIALADKLSHIHSHGFIHRDVKPDNILFDAAGRPFFSDFGLAVSDDEQLQEPQCVRGTVSYMAPEQARQQRVDRLADIYSLGVVIYQLLALPHVAHPRLALPYLANNSDEYLELLSDQRQQIRALPEVVPSDLAALIEHHCLTADKSQRFRSAHDLALALEQWQRRNWWTRRKVLALGVPSFGGLALAGWQALKVASRQDKNRITVHDLLRSSPQEPQSFAVDRSRTELTTRTNEVVLASFGSHLREPTDLEVSFAPGHWEGDYGVFFGHGTDPAARDGNYYQSLKLTKNLQGNLVLRTGGTVYRRTRPRGAHGFRELDLHQGLPMHVKEGTNTLRFRLTDGKLAQFWLNGVDISERIVPAWTSSKLGAFGQAVGNFGVMSNGGSCRFFQISLNQIPFHLDFPENS